jgi:hypothetical protein
MTAALLTTLALSIACHLASGRSSKRVVGSGWSAPQ